MGYINSSMTLVAAGCGVTPGDLPTAIFNRASARARAQAYLYLRLLQLLKHSSFVCTGINFSYTGMSQALMMGDT